MPRAQASSSYLTGIPCFVPGVFIRRQSEVYVDNLCNGDFAEADEGVIGSPGLWAHSARRGADGARLPTEAGLPPGSHSQ